MNSSRNSDSNNSSLGDEFYVVDSFTPEPSEDEDIPKNINIDNLLDVVDTSILIPNGEKTSNESKDKDEGVLSLLKSCSVVLQKCSSEDDLVIKINTTVDVDSNLSTNPIKDKSSESIAKLHQSSSDFQSPKSNDDIGESTDSIVLDDTNSMQIEQDKLSSGKNKKSKEQSSMSIGGKNNSYTLLLANQNSTPKKKKLSEEDKKGTTNIPVDSSVDESVKLQDKKGKESKSQSEVKDTPSSSTNDCEKRDKTLSNIEDTEKIEKVSPDHKDNPLTSEEKRNQSKKSEKGHIDVVVHVESPNGRSGSQYKALTMAQKGELSRRNRKQLDKNVLSNLDDEKTLKAPEEKKKSNKLTSGNAFPSDDDPNKKNEIQTDDGKGVNDKSLTHEEKQNHPEETEKDITTPLKIPYDSNVSSNTSGKQTSKLSKRGKQSITIVSSDNEDERTLEEAIKSNELLEINSNILSSNDNTESIDQVHTDNDETNDMNDKSLFNKEEQKLSKEKDITVSLEIPYNGKASPTKSSKSSKKEKKKSVATVSSDNEVEKTLEEVKKSNKLPAVSNNILSSSDDTKDIDPMYSDNDESERVNNDKLLISRKNKRSKERDAAVSSEISDDDIGSTNQSNKLSKRGKKSVMKVHSSNDVKTPEGKSKKSNKASAISSILSSDKDLEEMDRIHSDNGETEEVSDDKLLIKKDKSKQLKGKEKNLIAALEISDDDNKSSNRLSKLSKRDKKLLVATVSSDIEDIKEPEETLKLLDDSESEEMDDGKCLTNKDKRKKLKEKEVVNESVHLENSEDQNVSQKTVIHKRRQLSKKTKIEQPNLPTLLESDEEKISKERGTKDRKRKKIKEDKKMESEKEDISCNEENENTSTGKLKSRRSGRRVDQEKQSKSNDSDEVSGAENSKKTLRTRKRKLSKDSKDQSDLEEISKHDTYKNSEVKSKRNRISRIEQQKLTVPVDKITAKSDRNGHLESDDLSCQKYDDDQISKDVMSKTSRYTYISDSVYVEKKGSHGINYEYRRKEYFTSNGSFSVRNEVHQSNEEMNYFSLIKPCTVSLKRLEHKTLEDKIGKLMDAKKHCKSSTSSNKIISSDSKQDLKSDNGTVVESKNSKRKKKNSGSDHGIQSDTNEDKIGKQIYLKKYRKSSTSSNKRISSDSKQDLESDNGTIVESKSSKRKRKISDSDHGIQSDTNDSLSDGISGSSSKPPKVEKRGRKSKKKPIFDQSDSCQISDVPKKSKVLEVTHKQQDQSISDSVKESVTPARKKTLTHEEELWEKISQLKKEFKELKEYLRRAEEKLDSFGEQLNNIK